MQGNWIRRFFEPAGRQLTSSPRTQTKAFPLVMEQLEGREVPASSISIANASFAEGDSGTSLLNFTVSRSGDLDSELRVSYATADGTALAGVDYTARSDSLIMPAGVAAATISIP